MSDNKTGTPPFLMIEAHQEDIQETLIRSIGDFSKSTYNSAPSESPNVMEFPKRDPGEVQVI